ncbi:vacuolar protein sorting-associated protein 13B-like [Alosa sapidissima]|uniref:vacuolar protein sorting-associated protein 13B-like n=1 Tax=Alosa sapidissima TaxID=34773 RepID=UPI001C08B730|nr:vacuolar protein sorting-associated protein 13B-like [Alosa sapidissima]
MLESYVTPLLMSYVNRYIKNLKPSDLQLSLWGGDVVLSKLDLKLDVLEQELKLPFTFLSGHIHELRIHVPWTKLGSEPVVITINTMECILKLKDGAQDDHESCGSSSTSRSASDSSKSLAKPRRVQQAAPTDPDLPPGYVQSLIRRVANNVNIVVNNLILKYVEDDIVLSVNITSAECYTVDEMWDRAFMDIAAPDLVLRKVINFSDCTVCLDKRNASGKIEFYQDPLLYKCSFRTRLHFTYDNINSKIPAVIKIQTMVESLKLSMTDQQLPMFIRVMELALALYYGEIGTNKEADGDDGAGSAREVVVSIPGMEVDLDPKAMAGQYPSPDQYMSPGSDDDEQGWVSWAWSFVPAIVSEDEEDGEGGFYVEGDQGDGSPSGSQQHTPKDPIVSIGFYCTKASVTFKLTETQAESSYYSPQKVKSREVLCVEQEGITVEALMKGEPFFDCQIGFVGCRALCLKGIMGVRDFEENMNRREEDAVFFTCGENLSSKGMTYLTNSLFDYRSPENNGVRAEFILDGNLHKETYTEIAGMQRFGAFYLDYLYTMENGGDKVCVGSQDFSSAGKEEPSPPVQESSVKRLVVGPVDVRLQSSAVHRILKMVACALDHEYEPYCRPKPDVVEESRAPPTQEELAALEEFIPTRITSVTLLSISVTLCMAEFNLLHTVLPLIMGHKTPPPQASAPVFQAVRPLPAVRLLVERLNLEHSEPMYAPELVSAVSSLSQPSDNLLHHCYAHCYLKVFGFQAGLSSMDAEGHFLPLIPIVPSFSMALYGKLLRLPAYWTKRSSVSITECIFELPHFSLQGSRAQMLLLQAISQSWTHSLGSGASQGVSDGLLNDVYKTPSPGVKPWSGAPVLEASVQSVELKLCRRATLRCASGTVGAVKVCARTLGSTEGQKERLVPLIQGPSDTKELHQSRWLNELRKPESLLAPDLLAFSIQVPQQGDDCRNSGAVLLVSVQGVAVNVDPVFCTWLLYQPPRGSGRQQQQQQQQQTQGVPPVVMAGSKRREDEVSMGSAPYAKPPSNQASDYASSPVKTKTVTESRPLSIPMKVMPSTDAESWASPEERMKELIACVWDAVKRLTLQLELQSCCVFVPNDSLPSPSTIVCGDIPGTVRSWYHNQATMPGTLVVCLPQISVMSAGHKYTEPLQEIPFVVIRPILEEGDAFPWTVSLSQFSVYTLLGQQRSLSLLEPMGCTSTLAVTSHKLPTQATFPPVAPEGPHPHAFIVCLHVDLQPLHLKCSNPQVQLLYELFQSWSSTWSRLQRRGILRQVPAFPDAPASAATPGGPQSPVPSSAGTAPPDTSTCSPSADLCSPTEGDSVQAADDSPFCETVTLEQRTSSICGSSGKVSLWMQWMLPKVTAKLFAPDALNKKSEICVISEMEDLSASVDVQDVYTKIKCKVGSFNIDHYKTRPGEGKHAGHFEGVILQCKEKAVTAAKALEVSHQQHGFLSVTYTQAVTRNVRHKLTARQERGAPRAGLVMGGLGVGGVLGEGQMSGVPPVPGTMPMVDGSPQHLHEILLTAQPFDLVLSCPLLAAVAGVFRVAPEPSSRRRALRERGRRAGQPMRSHTLTSSSLPLIYVNTSIIRIFCPTDTDSPQKKEDTLVLKMGSVSMAPQADNPLTRTVLRKDIYQRAMNLGILRDPGSEVEDRQYQVDLQSINIGTARWEQLRPEKDAGKGGSPAEGERNSQNPALEWNMASSIRRHQERRAILTPILTDFSVRVTAAPAIIFSKPVSPDNTQVEEIVVCGHSLEVNVTSGLDFFLSVAQVQLLQQLLRANMLGAEGPEKSTERSWSIGAQGPRCTRTGPRLPDFKAGALTAPHRLLRLTARVTDDLSGSPHCVSFGFRIPPPPVLSPTHNQASENILERHLEELAALIKGAAGAGPRGSADSRCEPRCSLALARVVTRLSLPLLWFSTSTEQARVGGDGCQGSVCSDSESGSQLQCDQLVSPTALAACTRVDSCFAPWFVPSVGISLQLAQIQLRLCHHLEQLGTAPCQRLRPFLSDRKLPQEQEYMMIGVNEPRVYLRQWSGRRPSQLYQELSLSSRLECQLLEYRNLTLRPLVRPFSLRGQAAVTQGPQHRTLDGSVFVEPVFATVSQHMVHTLDTAVKGWQQNLNPEAEELVFSHYVICNDTQEMLRFGQVDTDENVLLACLNSHQYSWRSHKSPQLLHICIEGWGNWRWSEPFSIDNVGTLLRTIEYKGQTASLIIKVQQLSGVQKQVVICGRQVMCSYLGQALELRLVQHYVGADGQTVVREHVGCLDAGGKLPSYVLEDSELTELCVRARGDEDWSQDVRLDRRESSVVQVPCSNGSLLNVWCTLITLEADTHMQQRVVVFSPLFIMRSHLPDPVIIHVEKRSLGLKESQLIPGQGHEEALLNVEADLTHHLTFQAREDEDASQCAVPISSSLIKQIVSKAAPEEVSLQQQPILLDFYGVKTSGRPAWPYTSKDTDRSGLETVAQWDSPMQVKLSAWRPGLSTLLVELVPWALLANHSHWDLWLFEGERIVLQIPAGKVIVPPNFKEAFQIGIYWANTNTVHKSPALKLVHDLTSPRWKEGSSPEVITLDEDGFVEADITLGSFPGRQKVCQFCVSSVVRHGMQILQIEDRTILVNNTSQPLSYKALLSEQSLASNNEPVGSPDAAIFILAPARSSGHPRRCAVPCWDLLREGPQAEVESPLPTKHMLLSSAGPDGAAASWSLPVPVRPDFPRQSVAVPDQPREGLNSRALVVTYQEHMGITFITVSEDPCPRMLLHNRCPIAMVLKENLRETPRTVVFCRPLPPLSSLHHELYQQASSFPDCRPRESLPTLLLRAAPDPGASPLPPPDWTEPIDINSPGTQVVFLPSFGCLYVDVLQHGATVILTLAPESCAGTIISQHHRLSKQTLSFRVLLSEASLALCDDITTPSGSVELLRLTLSKLLLHLSPADPSERSDLSANPHGPASTSSPTAWDVQPDPGSPVPGAGGSVLELYCAGLQLDNQLYTRASFHFPVLLCQDSRTAEPSSSSASSSSSSSSSSGAPWSPEAHPLLSPQALQAYRAACFLRLAVALGPDFAMETVAVQMQPARVYLEDTFVYYVKTLFHSYLPESAFGSASGGLSTTTPPSTSKSSVVAGLPEEVVQATQALVWPLRLRRLTIQPVSLLVSIHASLKLYIASDHTPLAFSLFERGPVCTTARQLVHALAMHYAAGALFRAGWVVGSLEILGSPASLVRSIGNGIADFFRLPYEGLTRGPGAFVSGVSRGTTSFVKHISKGTLTSITNLATSLARNMDRLSLDEEHYTRQEEWRRQLPESLGDGLRQGLSRLGISLLGAIAGIVDQPMQNFQRTWEMQSSAGSKAKGVISGVGKGIVGVFTKPIGGAAELVSQTGYGILHGAGLWELPKQLYLPAEEQAAQASNSHLKYVWKLLQSLGRPEVHMALQVGLVSSSGQEHAGCLLLTADVLFVVSLCEDTQQQAFPITEVTCQQEPSQPGELTLTLQQTRVSSDNETDGGRERLSEQQYRRLVEYVTRVSQHLSPSPATLQQQQPPVTAAEPPPTLTKSYRYLVEPAHARVFVYKFTMVKNKALRVGFH